MINILRNQIQIKEKKKKTHIKYLPVEAPLGTAALATICVTLLSSLISTPISTWKSHAYSDF